MHRELCNIWLDIAVDDDLNAIILTGAGGAFCAGGDVKRMADRGGTSDGKRRTLVAPSEARRNVENIEDVTQPIIGAINSDAVDLGTTVALLTDITVAS